MAHSAPAETPDGGTVIPQVQRLLLGAVMAHGGAVSGGRVGDFGISTGKLPGGRKGSGKPEFLKNWRSEIQLTGENQRR